jgi:glycosyltransferase involved in cell wall biosynthesis
MKLLYSRADKIIAVSNFIRKDLILNYNIKKAKVVVIYNPIDIEKVNALASEEISDQWFREEVPIVISVGRLSKEKGYDTLLRAFAIAREKSDIRLAILGEGEEKKSLEELDKKLGIERDVVFLGYKNNPYKYMKRASIFVLSSLYEGFPNVLIEAMACGTPVISTQYNPYPHEIIEHGKNGLLVPVTNEKALAEAMLKLLNDPAGMTMLAANAKEKAKEFLVQKIAGYYGKVLLD